MRPGSALFLLALAGASCGHERPFAWAGPDTLGPFEAGVPRRLTFNPGDDRNPSVTGDLLVFSRLDGSRGRERCLAILAAAGGTLHRTVCPPPPVSPADTFVDTWVEPALSPDGGQMAFVWQKGAPASYYTWTRDLVVAPTNDLSHPTFAWPAWYVLPDGRIATAVSKPMWLGSTTLRFLAASERRADSAVGVVAFSGPVVDLADVAGVPVALLAANGAVEWIDLATGAVGHIVTGTPIRRIAAVPGTRRFVAEVENTDDPLASIGANLWLFGLP